MMRRILVVGDPPAPGGRVLPYGGPTSELHGHRVALIGGRAYCEGCNSVGIIAKAGGPRRPQFISATVDSQLSTLVHEVTHFDDTFGSFDTINHLSDSLRAAKATPDKVRNNADSIAGYVVWGESYGS